MCENKTNKKPQNTNNEDGCCILLHSLKGGLTAALQDIIVISGHEAAQAYP
jgi:hypothetical protein